jgi:multimeric flavodoxin WrbA
MKVIGFNGSPRKTWNTATLLKKALDGAASQGADTELIHLYDLNFRGCRSCFACKSDGGPSYGKCAVKDDLSPVLRKIEEADALVVGSPIYFGTITGEAKSFMERAVFPYFMYTEPLQSLFPRKIKTAFIYTMNVEQEMSEKIGYPRYFRQNELVMGWTFGNCESLYCYDTYQFDDYSKVVAPRFDPAKKAAHRAEAFPQDSQKAFDLGVRLATPMKA